MKTSVQARIETMKNASCALKEELRQKTPLFPCGWYSENLARQCHAKGDITIQHHMYPIVSDEGRYLWLSVRFRYKRKNMELLIQCEGIDDVILRNHDDDCSQTLLWREGPTSAHAERALGTLLQRLEKKTVRAIQSYTERISRMQPPRKKPYRNKVLANVGL